MVEPTAVVQVSLSVTKRKIKYRSRQKCKKPSRVQTQSGAESINTPRCNKSCRYKMLADIWLNSSATEVNLPAFFLHVYVSKNPVEANPILSDYLYGKYSLPNSWTPSMPPRSKQ